MEQALDLGAVGGGAVRVRAAAGMHKQRHGALQLRVALVPLLLRHPRPRLIYFARMRLHGNHVAPSNSHDSLKYPPHNTTDTSKEDHTLDAIKQYNIMPPLLVAGTEVQAKPICTNWELMGAPSRREKRCRRQ